MARLKLNEQQRHERAKDDAKTSNDFARYGAQAAILINGGAATAVLALLANIAKGGEIGHQLHFLPSALTTYACGVLLAAFSLPMASQSIELYMSGWFGDYESKGGWYLWLVALALIFLSLVSFMAGSLVVAVGLAPLVR